MSDFPSNCRNCHSPLAGEYCSQCGQREGRGDIHFSDAAGEVVEEFASWDSRFWSTLVPLLFRPGFLTAEFIAGRRARYMPAFRLYLFVSFVLFLVVSIIADDTTSVHIDRGRDHAGLAAAPAVPAGPGSTDEALHGGGEEPVARRREVASDSRVSLDLTPRRRVDPQGNSEVIIAPIVIGAAGHDSDVSATVGFSLADADSPQWLQDLDSKLEANAEKLADNPDIFLQSLLEYAPQMMFLLLPVFALLLQVAYLFSPIHYLQHAVFALHFHSFVYLLYLAGALVKHWLQPGSILWPVSLVVLLYLPIALRRAYGSSVTGAVVKAAVIIVIDTVLLLFSFGILSLLALALL